VGRDRLEGAPEFRLRIRLGIERVDLTHPATQREVDYRNVLGIDLPSGLGRTLGAQPQHFAIGQRAENSNRADPEEGATIEQIHMPRPSGCTETPSNSGSPTADPETQRRDSFAPVRAPSLSLVPWGDASGLTKICVASVARRKATPPVSTSRSSSE